MEIAQAPDHPWAGAPVIEEIEDRGHFVAVFADGDQASRGKTGLNFRIYDGSGNPVTNEIELTNTMDGSALSGLAPFDWRQIDIDYYADNNTFTVSCVGDNDGSSTGVYTSGPMVSVALSHISGNDSLGGGDRDDTTLAERATAPWIEEQAATRPLVARATMLSSMATLSTEASTNAEQIADLGSLAHWRFNETSGSVAAGSSDATYLRRTAPTGQA